MAKIRKSLLSAAMFLCALGSGTTSVAQSWPNRPVNVVVPYTAGSNSDLLARLFAQAFGEEFKSSFIVVNKPGGGGVIGSDFVAKAQGDGYTLLLSSSGTHSAGPWLYRKLPYDPIKDFASVALIHTAPWFLIVRSDIPARNVAEFVRYAAANREKVSFGYGSPAVQVVGAAFGAATGVGSLAVPYKGPSAAINDLLGGQVQFTFESMGVVLPYIQAGKVRAIGVTSPRRMSFAPEVPTIAESGYPGFEMQGWLGISAPAGTSHEVLGKIHAAAEKILADPAVNSKILALGLKPAVGVSQDQFSTFIEREYLRWGKMIKDAGIEAE